MTRNCPGILICHNHPSGDPTPSPVRWRKICQV
ncbi:MAG: JAB domain-containing protein [Ktedonobacteraceae bacterium]